jgi:hypothetical protein
MAKKMSHFKTLWRQRKFVTNYSVKGGKINYSHYKYIYLGVVTVKLKTMMIFYNCHNKGMFGRWEKSWEKKIESDSMFYFTVEQ